MKVGDFVKTDLWGRGLILRLVYSGKIRDGAAEVLVEKEVQGKQVRRIARPYLEVINESR